MTTARNTRLLLVLGTAFALGGCSVMHQHEASYTGNLLVAAGFRANPADTPQRAQQLRDVPPLKIESRLKGGNMVYYYADPYSCACLYVGDRQAYVEYQRLALEKQLARQQVGFVGVHGGGEPGVFRIQ